MDSEMKAYGDKMKNAADEARIESVGNEEVDPKKGESALPNNPQSPESQALGSLPLLKFTFRVSDPTQARLPQWTLVQYVDRRPDSETFDQAELKARHLLQRKLRRLADQLDPTLPCGSCSVLALKKKRPLSERNS